MVVDTQRIEELAAELASSHPADILKFALTRVRH